MLVGKGPIRRRKHRLPRDAYRGEIAVSFTACINGRHELFVTQDVVATFRDALRRACSATGVQALIFVFMPDHLHTILQGLNSTSDLWRTMSLFKQFTGYWLARHKPGVTWQGDFYDYIVRDDGDLRKHLRYIVDNPVRRGLVQDWHVYPFQGSDLHDLHEFFDRGEGPA
jgi:REP element-mobilizing transposase RayT